MLQKIETFLSGNKVFILGLLGAIVTALQQFTSPTVNWEVVAFAAAIAGLSYASKTISGKAGSLIGVLGGAIATISTVSSGAVVHWQQLLLTTLVAAGFVVSGGASSTTSASNLPISKN
jgi:peptidoglycan/LPS O-acetylase OafA/YrhL